MSPRPPARTGLGAIDAERFDVASAVGGWRGVMESAAPTLVFVVVMAVRPSALVAALAASLAVSAAARWLLPEPVGVPRMRWSPVARSSRASSWWGHSSSPRDSHQPIKSSSASSAGMLGKCSSSGQGMSAPSSPASVSRVPMPCLLPRFPPCWPTLCHGTT